MDLGALPPEMRDGKGGFMQGTREKITEIFKRFDFFAAQLWGRSLNDEEKAVAHSTIYEVLQESRAKGIPFSSGLEMRWHRLPAKETLIPIYELIRRQRKAIEAWLSPASVPSRGAARPPCLPFLGLKFAIGHI